MILSGRRALTNDFAVYGACAVVIADVERVKLPVGGERIEVVGGKLRVPDNPTIPVIEGDGIGPDIMRATRRTLDAAVSEAYRGNRRIVWLEVYAGEKAQARYGELLPQETLDAIRRHVVAIKGPLTTPMGGGFRSLNVTLRRVLDLYACVRPVRYIPGVPSRLTNPQQLDIVIFRENTEDVYAGIEYEQGSPQASKLITFLNEELGENLSAQSAVGIKPMSERGSRRIVRAAIRYALENGRRSVTIMHKGNIMKFTEGAFMRWGYEVAKEEFDEVTITESELLDETGQYKGKVADGKLVVKDRVADNMFPQLLLRPSEYDVIVTPNLNGDYLSDFAAALVGGLGLAPGANIDYETGTAIFEPTHGSAPKYANQDKVNPTSLMLSGALMLRYIGWPEAAELVEKGVRGAISQRRVTYDLARQMGGITPIRTSQYADAVIENIKAR